MVVVVTCVSDRHVLDHMTVCAQDVVDPGVHHPSSAVHAPCPAVLQPRLMLWKEVYNRVIKPRRVQGCCKILVPRLSLWIYQVGVNIAGHQQRAPPGPLAYGRNNSLYCRGVVWVQVAPHDELLLAS